MKCQRCQFENPPESSYCSKCGTSLKSGAETINLQSTQPYMPVQLDLEIGSLFADRYQILEELGSGGMGKVYKVMDREVKEKIAIKVLRPEISVDETTIERFRNELKLARKISHPNICRMYDLVKERGLYFITMEYVSGEDLKSTIMRVGQLSVGKALAVTRGICKGLAEAHKMGVVHRDLKPHNIIIDRDGDVRIMDFGIAHSLKTKGITETGVLIGTPEYISPEQAVGEEADQRSDIYSLGVILFECLTGTVPFTGDSAVGVALKHKSEPPPSPRSLNPQIPEDVNRLILRCLEKDREKRYQNVGEILEEISRILRAQPTTEKILPGKPPTTTKRIGVGKPRFRVALLVSALVLVAGVAGYLIYQILRPDGQKTGRLDLKSTPSGATVFVNGQERGTTPFQVDLAPATYELRIAFPGHRDWVGSATVENGRVFAREYALEPLVMAEGGQMEISSLPPGATVYLGESEKGTTPTGKISVPAGTHRLRLVLPGYEEIDTEIEVEKETPLIKEYELARISVNPPVRPYTVYVDSDPRGADIFINGRYQTKTPSTISWPESTFVLKIDKGDHLHEPWSETVSLKTGSNNPIRRVLKRSRYKITLQTEPAGAKIILDDSPSGNTPKTLEIPAGPHTVRFEQDGYQAEEFSVNITRDASLERTLARLSMVDVELISYEAYADIYIDGQLVSRATDKKMSVNWAVKVGERLIEYYPVKFEKISLKYVFEAGNTYTVVCIPSRRQINVEGTAREKKR